MKTGKIILFGILLLLTSRSLMAQEPIDTKAKAILDELSKKTKSYSSLKAEFIFTLENKDKKVTETQNGVILLKGNKYKLEIKGQEVISNNKTVWTYLKDANEVQVNNVDTLSTDVLNPSTIFTLYEKGYKFKFDREEVKGTSTLQTINLYPVNPDKKKFHTIKLTVDKAKKQIVMVKMLMKDGSAVNYTIKTFTINIDIKDASFTFDAKAHPGVEIVDLRE